MTKIEIIDKIAKDKLIEKILKQNTIKNPYYKDLGQDIYLDLLSKNDELIERLYENDELEYFIRKIITNNIFSITSPFYKKYQKFRKTTDPITYDESGDIINKINEKYE